jgi:hypothetical protein
VRERTWPGEWMLIVGFVAIIGSVPLAQIALELARGQRVRFTEVFCQAPTPANLRQYERGLEESSWAQQTLRPVYQRVLWEAFGHTTADAIAGLDGWMFYRPDVRYLLEPHLREPPPEDGTWVRNGRAELRRQSVVRAVVRFRDQLEERGIRLLVVPVPGKPGVYPEHLTRRVSDALPAHGLPSKLFIDRLLNNAVDVVDLPFETIRKRKEDELPLYLQQDTHWSPEGVRRAAHVVSEAARQLFPGIKPTRRLQTRTVRVTRFGDIPEMARAAGLNLPRVGQTIECRQVIDQQLLSIHGGLLIPDDAQRPGTFRYPGGGAEILLLGDSFCRIYQLPEPPSLGELPAPATAPTTTSTAPAATRPAGGGPVLLPGSAGFLSHLVLGLRAPVDAIISDGGASTDVRRTLNMYPEILENKKLVIWVFAERDIMLGRAGWQDVDLPVDLSRVGAP